MIDETGRRCMMEKESTEYLFFHCDDSSLIWKLAPVKWDKYQHLNGSFVDWWKAVSQAGQDRQPQKRVELTVYLLWQI